MASLNEFPSILAAAQQMAQEPEEMYLDNVESVLDKYSQEDLEEVEAFLSGLDEDDFINTVEGDLDEDLFPLVYSVLEDIAEVTAGGEDLF